MRLFTRLLTGLLAATFAIGNLTSARAVSPEEIQKIKDAAPSKPTKSPQKERKILVLNLCKGFKHSCIPYWDEALQIMGEKSGAFKATITSDLNMLKAETLNQYDALVLNNTTHLCISPATDPEICQSVLDFINNGKGIVGIHAATDNFYKWEAMQQLMGGKFVGHPWGGGGTWAVKIDEPDHPLTAAFKGQGFKVNDEIYLTRPPLYGRDKLRVVMSLDMADEKTSGVNGMEPSDKDTGITWIRNVGKGRLFYGSMGHNNHLTWNPALLQHYLDGIQFALGDYPMDATPKP